MDVNSINKDLKAIHDAVDSLTKMTNSLIPDLKDKMKGMTEEEAEKLNPEIKNVISNLRKYKTDAETLRKKHGNTFN